MADRVFVSAQSRRTFNPIREVVDKLTIVDSTAKPMIPLSIGDPTIFGNLPAAQSVIDAVKDVLGTQGKYNGYPPSSGYRYAREAVANKYSTSVSPLTAEDVVLGCGASGALEMIFSAAADPGDNILIPAPGFSLYTTLGVSKGIDCRYYPLLAERNWEIDLDQTAALITDRTRAIIVCNPSNPCGSVFSKEHLMDVLAFAEKHELLVISDEIYGNMVFPGTTFYPIADLPGRVPILTVSGLAKQYMVPGWRLGWILIQDRENRFADMRAALLQVSQLILGPCSLIQAALPQIFQTPRTFHDQANALLASNAHVCVSRLQLIDGLIPIAPQGTMYILVKVVFERFEGIFDDVDFAQKLLKEQFVFVLPGSAFKAPGFFRIVFCAADQVLHQSFDRIDQFCTDHRVK